MDSSCHNTRVSCSSGVWQKCWGQFSLARSLWKGNSYGQFIYSSFEINHFTIYQHAAVRGRDQTLQRQLMVQCWAKESLILTNTKKKESQRWFMLCSFKEYTTSAWKRFQLPMPLLVLRKTSYSKCFFNNKNVCISFSYMLFYV